MESETRTDRQRRQSRESHARWAKRHPRAMKAARKRWARSTNGQVGEAHKKAVEKTRREVMRALGKPGGYVVLCPDGSQVRLHRAKDGKWEILP